MSDSQLPSEKRLVHFGPVYGRPVASSLALCDKAMSPPGSSKTMTRSLGMVTCDKCEQAIQDLITESVIRGQA